MNIKMLGLLAAVPFAIPMAAEAAPNVQSGKYGNLTWQAQSMIVGQTPTGGFDGGGDPIYYPTQPQKRGVVALIMEYDNGDRFICSGNLASDRRSIITAGHCVSGGFGTANPATTTAYFWDGGADDRVPFNPAAVAIKVTDYYINPEYTGEVIDQNDLAVLRLQGFAPDFATAYEIYTGPDLTGRDFNVAGYGQRSDTGGAAGRNQRTGFLREGDNNYAFAFGDSDFGGFFTEIIGGENFFGTAEIDFSYVSDFDNGLAANDASCLLATLGLGLAASPKFCNTGLGAREVGIAGGDSGGGGFIDGQLSHVNSYGLSFGPTFGDFGGGLNSGWGEFSGYVPLNIHADFINGVLGVPEPATWGMMIAGFGMVGASARRVRRAKASLA